MESWENSYSYQRGRQIVNALPVVNDSAERGVKLATDFNKSVTLKEASYQNLLLTVQSHRKKYPDVKKSTLLKNL